MSEIYLFVAGFWLSMFAAGFVVGSLVKAARQMMETAV